MTERYKALAMRPELEVGNMTWSSESMLSKIVPKASGEFYNFVQSGAACVRNNQAWHPTCAGQFFNWKIRQLSSQLKLE
ncbi:hypothetical protein [Paenibacillus roseipurpureus]|uniref:Uncharacterized protein n=1 Tax=Paenibacillus roseopurpureus TaxID=2918901 RepID=A0AA96RLK5_9BACL|nr:hypothetical protein [Paenibacillus sp. MBLB1832]WNR45770.1 hypothetical protein MJB10_06620 [Paenibacillus sp. MBLB1832]